jgi:hypothetical protein
MKKTLSILFVALFLFVGCGGDDGGDSDGSGGQNAADGVDGAALEETMADFATEVESEFGFFSAPEFQESDQSLLGYLPTGVDPVTFCDRLSEYVAEQGFEGVTISVKVSANGPELAAGTAGDDCEAV